MTRIAAHTVATVLFAIASGLAAPTPVAASGVGGGADLAGYSGRVAFHDGAMSADLDLSVDGLIVGLPGTGKVVSGEMIVGDQVLDIDFEDDGKDLRVSFDNKDIVGDGTCEVSAAGRIVCNGEVSLPWGDTDFVLRIVPHTESS